MVDTILRMADDNGCITWFQAVRFANSHGILEDLFKDYEVMIGEPVDAGELLV